ncbi:putative DNA-directed RNA polymerase polypeptide [Leishmania infantum JPCM5]|uniref:DNA-directed RNA polymerase subunit beta n=2 Tax=Leishmania infantum TaxID=5671 RepID=A0A6L0XGE0_LEIIN|nr:putative DNA-directed RNA polymerase polypeptide [Leishmania infantum JPCM5]CAC9483967.1 DNA-directed_RNA_polymerase_II_subunit_2_-_putative [Leishmania infantum]CBZ08599.1 putative DNA-directed RNA polymerase polypeptide [Leishmania infantum JPCM5]SUZ41278.1 DNA-directed_RNA_polymerase_II_subunit_2_-_putative [Leishmania infantum]|eukprot:XP_003392438.1 putative DNA-directed RNA polymerase polypeptide [Leishmania infantum JPCM5]
MATGAHAMSDFGDEYQRKKLEMLPALMAMRGILNHHIASFDHLIEVELQRILLNESNVEIKSTVDPDFVIRYQNIRICRPQEIVGKGHIPKLVTPQECRVRDMTYRGDMIVDVQYTSRDRSRAMLVEKDVKIGTIPIMLKSKCCNLYRKTREELVNMRECPLDPGGYFIIKGVEKVCLVQEQQSKNRVIIEADEHGNISAHVQSKTHYSISKCAVTFKKGSIVLTHRSFTEDIPIIVVLKALGLENDQHITQCIGTSPEFQEILFPCFEEARLLNVVTQNDALQYIGEKRKETVWEAEETQQRQVNRSKADKAAEFLANVLLCHIREAQVQKDWNFRHKAFYVCFMVRGMIEASFDASLLDERDFYGNKRFETTGTLMALLFEDLLKQFNRVVKTAMDQQLSKKDSTRPFNVKQLMESKMEVIQNGMRMAISSGRWDLKRFNMNRQGITQVLSRLSYIASLGMMTRLASSFEKTRKVSGPRSLQPSQWGMVCPCDTPEGESCGLVKNFATLSQVTLDLNDSYVRAAAHALGVEEIDTVTPTDFLHYYTVFLNGTLIGIHRYPNRLCAGIRALRRSGRLHPHVSISTQPRQRTVQIGSDGGRIVRLLIIVRDGKPAVTSAHLDRLRDRLCTHNDFLAEGLIEYVDVNESNDCLIAVYPADIGPYTTHLEVEPLSLLGVVAGIIPYPHHNQSARNTFQSAMGKQALGTVALNQYIRADTVLLLGAYPQRPLCRTKAMSLTHYEKLGAGINAMVCVMSYSGYDIEDAQVYNKSSLDRGYGRCVVLRKHEVDLEKYAGGEFDVILPPEKNSGTGKFKALNPDGVASKGALVQQYDVLVNKFTPVAGGDPRPAPLVYKYPQPAVVDHVIISPPGDYDRSLDVDQKIKVITREVRPPEPGDKFSSRHGQKGVVGLIVNGVDMPFNERGMCPDMIMNPHGFPSRMTVGKLLELVCSKAAALRGSMGDGTAFGGDSADSISQQLLSFGYNYHGKDVFYSGITGDLMQGYVFFGPIYYQRLKHMVTDKMHARSTGPRSMLTRQPTEGRSRSGGLRVGEMERDCMVGYGASNLLNERLLISSDMFTADICHVCGNLGYNNRCTYCKTKGTTSKVNMPYAFKLLIQELQGMGVSLRLTMDPPT